MAIPLTYPPFSEPLYSTTGVMTRTWVQFFERLYQTVAVTYGVVGTPSSISLGSVAMMPQVETLSTEATLSSMFFDPSLMEYDPGSLQNFSVVNVKDNKFGAKGDGVTDDTEAIQAAIIYCQQTGTENYDGGILFFPPGIYNISTLDFNIQDLTGATGPIFIQGSGEYNTCIYATGGLTALDMSGIAATDSVHIKDLTIKGTIDTTLPVGTAHGIHINISAALDSSTVTIENVRVYQFQGKGIYIQDASNVSLENVISSWCGDDLIHLGVVENSNLTNCNIAYVHCGYSGFKIEYGYAVLQNCIGMVSYFAFLADGLPYPAAYWGYFGNSAGSNYVRATFIGCIVQGWNLKAIHFETDSSGNFFSTNIIGPAGIVNLVAIEYDGINEKHLPVFDAMSRITHGGGGSTWLNGSPIRSVNAPFLLLGYNQAGTPEDLEQYYDTVLLSLKDLPIMRSFKNSNNDSGTRFNNLAIEEGDIDSGTYTPTLTNVANLDSSTAGQCQYMRVGNVVTVSGRVVIDPTALTDTELGISLPVASNFTEAANCAGTGHTHEIAGEGARVYADPTNNRARMAWVAGDVTDNVWSFIFTYLIL